MSTKKHPRFGTIVAALAVIASLAPGLPYASAATRTAAATATAAAAEPASVNLAGSLQSAATNAACGNWDPGCPGSKFTPQGNNVFVFQSSAPIPAGAWEYKVALGSWNESYGGDFKLNGPNIALSLAAARTVRFYYDHKTHYIADNARNTIYTVPGSFNSKIGCSADWQPDCLRTLMVDLTGSGVYTFATDQIPAGNYEFKIATNESWSNPNYGQGGGPNNIPFTVAGPALVTFRFNTATSTPDVIVQSKLPSHDNNVEWDGLKHDSRDTLYRTPSGASPAGTPVTLRFRTYHDDVTSVGVRLYSVNRSAQQVMPMSIAASDVSCYDASMTDKTCDFWQLALAPGVTTSPDNLWYRFIIADGTSIAYYGDDTPALDGGLGKPTKDAVDQSWALMIYDPAFKAPSWVRNAVIYQIFPDRFNNGDTRNDPKTGDVRYDDPVLALPWGTLPEGYCRNYADANTSCPWRFDTNPPASSPTKESPRGRDYFGGDLRGVRQKLSYLASLGVTAIYFNPIFAAKSNHRYDTANYLQIDPALGNLDEFKQLVDDAKDHGIRIILDGVFNHMSSDSPNFDRYHHYPQDGACESASSPFRNWFTFRAPAGSETATCAPTAPGGTDTFYNGWFGFDSIPVLNKTNPDVQSYFVTSPGSVTRYWLKAGASAWRMDVMSDPSFPTGYWETFRTVVKQTKPDALIIGELWQKDSTLLRFLRGDRADTTMDYRMRDAVIGLLAPGAFDPKGFADSGRVLKPSEFASRMQSIREDYPDAAYYALMNLLDSHDTARLLWTLTPGTDTRADKEQNTANVSAGKRRQQLASLIQFTMPGAPTVYYGDEVGLTGADDPDDRRTYPWNTPGVDNLLRQHYSALSEMRTEMHALTDGDVRFLVADDTNNTLAFARTTEREAAFVVLNRDTLTQTVLVPTAGIVPDGRKLLNPFVVGTGYMTPKTLGGTVSVTLPPLSAIVLEASDLHLKPTAPPSNLTATEGNAQVSLAWSAVSGAVSYNVYRSPVSGGGWVKVNTAPVTALQYTDTGLANAKSYFYTVKALDKYGNESAAASEVSALPHLTIGWANTQWPPVITHTISVITPTDTIYGQVFIDGVTNKPGPTSGLMAQLGFGPVGTNPAGNAAWQWVDATFNTDAGNNDEFKASLLPDSTGTFAYVYRYSTTHGRDWLYADLSGPLPVGTLPPNPGKLTVVASADQVAPVTPANVHVTGASPINIALAWDAITGDPTLYGYEVLRGSTPGGPYDKLGIVTSTSYTDTTVVQGLTYVYVVRAVDLSFNRSGNSVEVSATAQLRTVTLQFNVTVPASTDSTGRSVYIAGFLDRLNGNLPQWNPSGVVLTRVNPTQWTITLTGTEGTQIEYKYVQGDWNYVEKDGACGEINNRQLTLSFGATGTQVVNDTVPNWRNVAPCGN